MVYKHLEKKNVTYTFQLRGWRAETDLEMPLINLLHLQIRKTRALASKWLRGSTLEDQRWGTTSSK